MIQIVKHYYTPIGDFIYKHNDTFERIGVLVNVLLCLLCLTIWMAPTLFSPEFIFSTIALLAFEFILLHSALFMVLSYWLFIPVYFLFAYAFNKASPDNSIMIIYLLTVLNRVRYIFSTNSDELQGKSVIRGIYYFFYAYFPLMLLVIVLELIGLIPELGMGKEVLKDMGYKYLGRSDLDPQTMMLFGVLYYSRTLLLERKWKKTLENAMNIVVIGRGIISQKISRRLTAFSHRVTIVVANPIAAKKDEVPNEFSKSSFSEWIKKNKRINLTRFDGIEYDTDLIINTEESELAIDALNEIGIEKTKEATILDLSKINYLSNYFPEEKPMEHSRSVGHDILTKYPESSVVELTTNLSCEGLIKVPFFGTQGEVRIKSTDATATDKVKFILQQFGWKDIGGEVKEWELGSFPLTH